LRKPCPSAGITQIRFRRVGDIEGSPSQPGFTELPSTYLAFLNLIPILMQQFGAVKKVFIAYRHPLAKQFAARVVLLGHCGRKGCENVKVEILYTEDCPNWQGTLEDVQAVLRGKSKSVEMVLTEVSSQDEAQELKFLGSPTIRINDSDIEWDVPENGPFGLTCRVYDIEGAILGRPPREWIDAAIDVLG
jgi:hypothetical protein